jgi:NDP-sugar pyrophosphorylase family protein
MDNETADYFRNADGQFDDDSIIDMALDILSNLDDAAFDELRKPQE